MRSESEGTIELPGFVLDLRQCELRDRSGERVPLRPQAFAMLQYLAQRAGRLVTKDELMQAVWPGRVVTDDSLVQCIKLIRHVLGDDERRILQTEPKRGYRLVVAADTAAATPAAAARFHQDIRFAISSGGVRIAYATSGHGPPLVRAAHWMTHLEHDWCSPANGEWIQGLSRRYRLLRYDGRGWGLSDRGFATWSLDEQVADLEAVVDSAGFDRCGADRAAGASPSATRRAIPSGSATSSSKARMHAARCAAVRIRGLRRRSTRCVGSSRTAGATTTRRCDSSSPPTSFPARASSSSARSTSCNASPVVHTRRRSSGRQGSIRMCRPSWRRSAARR